MFLCHTSDDMKMITFLMLSILAFTGYSVAQPINMPDLFRVLNMPQANIDTLMKQRQYRLLQKETDSGSSLIYYTNLERNPNGASWVRSVSVRERTIGKLKGRMLTYRTYRKKEYLEILEWFLRNNYKTVKRDNYGEYIDTIYSDGAKNILVKQSKQKLPSGVMIWSYEFEIGM